MMLWNEVVSDGLVVTGVLVLVSQMVFVSKVPKCLDSAEMQGGGICPSPYIYICVVCVCVHVFITTQKRMCI